MKYLEDQKEEGDIMIRYETVKGKSKNHIPDIVDPLLITSYIKSYP